MHAYQLRRITSKSLSILAIVFLLFSQVLAVQAQEQLSATPTPEAAAGETLDSGLVGTPLAEGTPTETPVEEATDMLLADPIGTPVPQEPTAEPTVEITVTETATPVATDLPVETPVVLLETSMDAHPDNPSSSASASFSLLRPAMQHAMPSNAPVTAPSSPAPARLPMMNWLVDHTHLQSARTDLSGNLDETPASLLGRSTYPTAIRWNQPAVPGWALTGSMNISRDNDTTNLLNNGRVSHRRLQWFGHHCQCRNIRSGIRILDETGSMNNARADDRAVK